MESIRFFLRSGFSLLILVVGLSGCCNNDCAPADPLRFRLLDNTGKDLISEVGISPGAIVLQTMAGERIAVDRFSGSGPYLVAYLIGSPDGYAITYDGQVTTFTVVHRLEGNDRCCGPLSVVEEVNMKNGKVPAEEASFGTAYVIQLE